MWLGSRVSEVSRKEAARFFHLRLFSSPPFMLLPIKVVVCVGRLLDLLLPISRWFSSIIRLALNWSIRRLIYEYAHRPIDESVAIELSLSSFKCSANADTT
jgi:hypothetical protein